MMDSLSGKCALVTGAGTAGIGRAVAIELARRGADLVVHDRVGSGLDETVRLVQDMRPGVRVVPLTADFSAMAAARTLVGQACASLGRIDIVIANAGMSQRKPILELTDADMQNMLAVNLLSTMALTQEAAKVMVGAGRGSIVIVGSINEDRVIPEQAHYCASKGGLRQWGRALAAGLGPSGVRVNLLCPGAIDTPMNQAHLAAHPERQASVLARTPLRRLGEPWDIARAAAFLASDESGFVTGASLFIDGGMSLA